MTMIALITGREQTTKNEEAVPAHHPYRLIVTYLVTRCTNDGYKCLWADLLPLLPQTTLMLK